MVNRNDAPRVRGPRAGPAPPLVGKVCVLGASGGAFLPLRVAPAQD